MAIQKTEKATLIKWSDLKAGDIVKGEVKNFVADLAGNGPVMFLKGEAGDVGVPLPAMLGYLMNGTAKFEKLKRGDYVEITYQGKKPSSKNPKKEVHSFDFPKIARVEA